MKRKFWFAALAAALVLLLGAESDLPCTVEEDELSFTLDFAPAGEEAPGLIRLLPRETGSPVSRRRGCANRGPAAFRLPRGRFAPSEGCQSGRAGRRERARAVRRQEAEIAPDRPSIRAAFASAGFVRAPFRPFPGEINLS